MKRLFNMKNVFLALLCAAAFTPWQLSAQEPVCMTQLLDYDGPKNSTELSARLDAAPGVLASLSEGTKASLVEHIVFENDFPSHLDGTDANIEAINESNANEIWSAVFNCPVYICTYDTKPSVTSISYDEFMALYASNPSTYTSQTAISFCSNCKVSGGPCCDVGGDGCYDRFTELDLTKERYSIVISE